ncbi:TlpA family protein disulfide reductase [Flavisolibacter nicotianae]|uniref:TlpA family protein disulfide reductase n=1 Tax=Flavisolibacter nicotianae TaxID=2364882 RepID=UPI0013C4BAC3|nr:TlpA disulfide reductase family protein [Flavisolibacter nicotianae]
MTKLVNKKNLQRAGNFLFWGLLIVLLINTDAKAWLLKQLVNVGLFKAEIKKEAPLADVPADRLSFAVRDESGKAVSTADLRGKVVFINFWATWCPPCRAEMSSLNDMYNELKGDSNLVFLFISEDDNAAKAKRYLQDKGFSMPLLARSGTVPPEIFSGTLPTTVVLNREGKLVYRNEGIGAYNHATFKAQLKSLASVKDGVYFMRKRI